MKTGCTNIKLFIFSRPLVLQCCVRLSVVSDVCIVAKRCILQKTLLLTAYRKLLSVSVDLIISKMHSSFVSLHWLWVSAAVKDCF